VPSTIEVTPIGIIHTPYTDAHDIPIQGTFKANVEGWIELAPEYEKGLKDLDGFSHGILLYHFHRSHDVKLQAKPYLEDVEHGIFAIRSSNRPNHLGISIVKIVRIEKNRIYFNEVDTLDGTPLLDIKPYCSYFDSRENTVCGWIQRHFENNQMPERTILR